MSELLDDRGAIYIGAAHRPRGGVWWGAIRLLYLPVWCLLRGLLEACDGLRWLEMC